MDLMKKNMKKKAIIFSIIAITISELVFFLFLGNYSPEINIDIGIINNRISSVNQEIDRFIDYVPDAGAFAGFSALEKMYVDINNTGAFFSSGDFDDVFLDCMTNDTSCPNNLQNLLDVYTQNIHNTRNFDLSLSIHNASIVNEASWFIDVRVGIGVNVHDEFADWNFNRSVYFSVSIEGVHDPTFIKIKDLYGGSKERVITPVQAVGSQINLEVFTDMLFAGQYMQSQNGSCLSDRFEGVFVANNKPCGIESVVNAHDYPGLLAPENLTIPHLDFQVANADNVGSFRCVCDDGNHASDVCVGIGILSDDITLNRGNLPRYGLFWPWIYNMDGVTGNYISNACP